MANIECILPAMGEGIIEATITRWFVREGDRIEKDAPLLEVATDKVDSEVPAPVSGIVARIIYHEGEIPKIGAVLALIDDGITHKEPDSMTEGGKLPYRPAPVHTGTDRVKTRPVPGKKRKQTISSDQEITPFIRFLAKDRGIPVEELKMIRGSGLKGRILKEDLLTYIRNGRIFQHQESAASSDMGTREDTQIRTPEPGPGEEVIPMGRTRKLIAEHMVRSKKTSPHVTSMIELDVTGLVQWRESKKQLFQEKLGVKLTYTPIIVAAAVKALKAFPDINISVYGDSIIRKKYIHIGVATALPDGNLIVPVIKDADKRNFGHLAVTLADLAQRARLARLEPAEIKGGTFTITNMGQYDNISGTPIINQPEVAILAVGAIKKKPAVVNVNGQDTVGIREIMVLSLTYDHRVVDGALGGSFVRAIGEYLVSEFPDF